MAEPMQYDTFGKMMLDHAPFIIAGCVSLVGGTILVLHKLGFLRFSKEEEKPKTQVMKCPAHTELHDTQVRMLQQQKINTQQLQNGKKEFKKMHDEITDLKVGVGILLDRTGGRPPGYKDK